jgi:putative component of toxin-antitoxin plasmid stabilization module
MVGHLLYGKILGDYTRHKLSGIVPWLEEHVGPFKSCLSTYWSDSLVKAKEAEWVDTRIALGRFANHDPVLFRISKIMHFTGTGWEIYYGEDCHPHTATVVHVFARVDDEMLAMQLRLTLFI